MEIKRLEFETFDYDSENVKKTSVTRNYAMPVYLSGQSPRAIATQRRLLFMKISKKILQQTNDPLTGDLSDLLKTGDWTKVKFELRPKDKTVTLRMSGELLSAVKNKAKESGLDYQKWIRIVLERLVS